MRIDRSLLNWGVFLIALGGIPLAVDQGWLETDIASDLGRLWPLILVGIGLGLVLRWTPLSWFGGALVAATFGLIFGAAIVTVRDDGFDNLQGIIPAIASGACVNGEVGTASTSEGSVASPNEFELDVSLSCGELDVSRATVANWSLQARHAPDDPPQIAEAEREGATAYLRVSQDSTEDLAFFGRRVQSIWAVEVPARAALRMQTTLNAVQGAIDAGAGPLERIAGTLNATEVTIDLVEATTPQEASVDLTLNASDGRLLLPEGDIAADITLNASSLVVCVPTGAGLRVDYSSVLSGDDLASSDLSEESPGQWISEGLTTTADRVSLSVTSTASSFSIERPEACS